MSKRWSACWIGLMWMAACSDVPPEPSGDDPGTTSPPPAQVVVDTAPASAADCPHGGSIVRSGIDDNHNHQLDEGEVRTRTPVCDAAAAPTVVVRIVAEPAGDGRPCPHGGTAVQSGPDANANGALDDDEVAHTDLLCGALLATRFRSEPAGAHCRDGGVAFDVGPDANDNGRLDDGEVAHTDFSCGDIVARSVTVGSAADAAALTHIRVIAGQLAVTAAGSVALPDLEHLIGDLAVVDNGGLTQLRMAKLADVSGSLRLRNAAQLATLAMPMLTRIGGDLELRQLPVLPDMDGLFAVHGIAGAVTLDANAALASVDLPLKLTGALTVTANPRLTELTVFGGNQLGPVTIRGNGLHSVSLSTTLVSSHEDELASTTIADNPALTTVDITTSAVGALRIENNAELASVKVSALTHVDGDVVLTGNPKHHQMQVGATGRSPAIRFAGSLIIEDPIVQEPILNLFSVGGDCRFSNTQVSNIGLLTDVGRSLIVENAPNLSFFDFPLTVGGDLVLTGIPRLTDLDFLQNAVFPGKVTITDNAGLRNLESLGLAFEFDDDVTIENNPQLRDAFTGAITSVLGRLRVAGNPLLTSLPLDGLEFASGLQIADNAALAAIALPAAVTITTIEIHGNAAAQHLAMPALRFAETMTVDDNPQLPSCEVTAVFGHIETPPRGPVPELEQHGNDDTKVCTPGDGSAP